MTKTIIDVLRHGEPVGGKRIRGQQDDPLSEKGWRQMHAAVPPQASWDLILSSPLRRCAEFARVLAKQQACPLEIDHRWMELGFGAWEGLRHEQVNQKFANGLSQFQRSPSQYTPPGAESLAAFQSRVLSAWHSALQQYQGKHFLIVAHAGIIRLLCQHLLDMPIAHLFRLQVPNAALVRIQIEGEGAQAFPRIQFQEPSRDHPTGRPCGSSEVGGEVNKAEK